MSVAEDCEEETILTNVWRADDERVASACRKLPVTKLPVRGFSMKIWRFDFAFAFVMESQINSPRFSFTLAFVMVMLGTHKPQQQATLTNKNPRDFVSLSLL